MGLFIRTTLPLLIFLSTQIISCVDIPEFEPLNPCDPEYQGDKPCPADLVDSGVQDVGSEPLDAGNGNDSGLGDAGLPADKPCLNDDGGGILPRWCLIDNTCYQAGSWEPVEGCKLCDPAQSNTSWTNRPNEISCSINQDPHGEVTGQCRDGHCIPEGCECGLAGTCCDGCHPVNMEEECFQDALECTKYQCSDQGLCEQKVEDGWCLTDESQCRNTLEDPANCGGCGIACDQDEVCTDGQCQPDCGGELTLCLDQCVDLGGGHDH